MSFSGLVLVCAVAFVAPLLLGMVPRVRLPAIVLEILAGILIGPHLLGWAGHSGDVHSFAEFGVVMMLFLIGLELQPRLLWNLRVPILGLGTLQVTATAAARSRSLISAREKISRRRVPSERAESRKKKFMSNFPSTKTGWRRESGRKFLSARLTG